MKVSRLLSGGLMVFAISCSGVYDVQFDYDTKADFSNLKTYNWLPIPEAAKGLKKTSENPDFSIATHVGSKDKVRVTNWGYGYAP